MTDLEQKTVDRISAEAERVGVVVKDLVASVKTVTVLNPSGFDFECSDRLELVRRVAASGKFGFDDPSTLHGFLAGCNARRTGFNSSFRQTGTGASLHIQIGIAKCNIHLDSIGISPARDGRGANVFDLSKIVDHWNLDLRPEMGGLKHLDLKILRGKSEVSGTSEFGAVLSVLYRFK